MDVLILGASRIAHRRVIPALQILGGVSAIHVASRTGAAALEHTHNIGSVYDDYAKAVEELPSRSLVYVSLPNSMHSEWARTCLMAGHHIVIDKPATLSANDAESLAELARDRDLCIAEAIVWQYHPQVKVALQMMKEAGGITAATAVFSVPPFPQGDIRNNRELGGGCVNDMGPYAVTAGRVILGDPLEAAQCKVRNRDGVTGVDTAFSVMNSYAAGVIVGHFGFGTNYTHTLTMIGPQRSLTLERPFAPPPDSEREVRWSDPSGSGSEVVPAADTFALFLADVLNAISNGDMGRFSATLRADAAILDRLREAVPE